MNIATFAKKLGVSEATATNRLADESVRQQLDAKKVPKKKGSQMMVWQLDDEAATAYANANKKKPKSTLTAAKAPPTTAATTKQRRTVAVSTTKQGQHPGQKKGGKVRAISSQKSGLTLALRTPQDRQADSELANWLQEVMATGGVINDAHISVAVDRVRECYT